MKKNKLLSRISSVGLSLFRIISFMWLAELISKYLVEKPVRFYITWVRSGTIYRTYFSYTWQIIVFLSIVFVPYLSIKAGIEYSDLQIYLFHIVLFIFGVFIISKMYSLTEEEETDAKAYIKLKEKQRIVKGNFSFWN